MSWRSWRSVIVWRPRSGCGSFRAASRFGVRTRSLPWPWSCTFSAVTFVYEVDPVRASFSCSGHPVYWEQVFKVQYLSVIDRAQLR